MKPVEVVGRQYAVPFKGTTIDNLAKSLRVPLLDEPVSEEDADQEETLPEKGGLPVLSRRFLLFAAWGAVGVFSMACWDSRPPEVSIAEVQPPTVELISAPEYPTGATSFSVKLQISDPDGLHQVILFTTSGDLSLAAGFHEVKTCRGLEGKKDAVVELDFDDDTPSYQITFAVRPIHVKVVDTDGNVRYASYDLVEVSPYQIATLLGHGAGVPSVSFSPDGATLASGSLDGTVKLWNVSEWAGPRP